MTTPRIEEMMREFERFTIMDVNRILLHGEAEKAETWLRQALTEARQEGYADGYKQGKFDGTMDENTRCLQALQGNK